MTKIKLFKVTVVNIGFINCNKPNCLDCIYLQNSSESWYHIECCSKNFIFNSSCDKNLKLTDF